MERLSELEGCSVANPKRITGVPGLSAGTAMAPKSWLNESPRYRHSMTGILLLSPFAAGGVGTGSATDVAAASQADGHVETSTQSWRGAPFGQAVELLIALSVAVTLLWLSFFIGGQRAQTRMRVEQAHRDRESLAHQVALLEGLQGLLLQMNALVARVTALDPVRGELESALILGTDLVKVARSRARQLFEASAEGITFSGKVAALRSQLDATGLILSQGSIVGLERRLQPMASSELSSLVEMAMRIAIERTEMRPFGVVVDYGARELTIRLSYGVLQHDVRLPSKRFLRQQGDGTGFSSMYETARRISATLEVFSRHDMGTCVFVKLASRLAYER